MEIRMLFLSWFTRQLVMLTLVEGLAVIRDALAEHS
jgi:hypothetical protein